MDTPLIINEISSDLTRESPRQQSVYQDRPKTYCKMEASLPRVQETNYWHQLAREQKRQQEKE